MTFTKAPAEYTVHLTKINGQGQSETFVSVVICKYVRREIRSLTEEDRERYFAALEVVAKTDFVEGQAKYGSKFVNLEYFAVKHINGLGCSPYHGGTSFVTAHAAFTLQLEQALQSVDPMVSQPYWDYTIDSMLYDINWERSPLFARDW